MKACGILSSWVMLAGMVVVAMSSRSGAQSAVGTAFTYQGSLREGAAPSSGIFDFEMSLWDGPAAGTMVGSTLEVGDVAVTDGLFTVLLDFGNQFSGNARWLEIGVRPGAETGAFTPLAPRQRITPSPVAIHAASAGDADLLDGLDSMDFAGAAHMHAGGGINSLDASDGDPVDAVFVDAEGNTGIGTTAPTAGLHAARPGPDAVDPELIAEAFDTDGTFSQLSGAGSVFVSGTTAYIASFFDNSLTIIDLSDPMNPALLSELVDGDGTFNQLAGAISVYVEGTTAYVASSVDDSLTIINVSIPSNPALLAEVFDGDGTFSRLEGAVSVFVSGRTAYVASLDDDSLTLIDVSDPMNPTLLAEVFDSDGVFAFLDGARSVFVEGTTAYVASQFDDSFTIIDVTDPTSPARLAEIFDNDGTFGFLDGAISVFVSGTTAYVASLDDSSLTVIDVGDPTNPVLLAEVFDGDGTFSRLGGAFSVFVSGTTAYVASFSDGSLTLIDVGDPLSPTRLAEVFDGDGTFSLLGGAISVFVEGTTAYVVSQVDDSLTLIDVGARPLYFEVEGDTLISGGTGSVRLTLEADTDNTGEGDQPRLTMVQDGGLIRADAGFLDATNNFEIRTRGTAASDILLNPRNNVGIHTSDPTNPLEVGTDTTNGNGAHVTAGGVWTNGSDRNSKTGFTPIDPRAILERLATLPVTQWRYLGEPEDVRHVGPMAQDFMEAFGLGASERHIGTIDADGIALAAIQGLYQKAESMERELKRRESALETLSLRNARLEARLERNALLAARNAQLEARIVAIERALGLN